MIFQFGDYKIDVDVEKTRNYYKNAELISEGCSCQGCRNFEKAVEKFPEKVLEFFNSLGVDVRKVTEVFAYHRNSETTILYGGFCHICGKVISGENGWTLAEKTENPTVNYWDNKKTYKLTDNFEISFDYTGGALLEDDFPRPVFQMDFMATIDYVLNEECTIN